MMKKIIFEEKNKVITITLFNENGATVSTLDLKDYALTGKQIFQFLSYEKGGLYETQTEEKTDSPQMKELKKLFTSITTRINAYSSAEVTAPLDSMKK
jgi:hypothetical protein